MTICNKVTEVFANANASVKYQILNRMAMRKTAVLVARANDPFNSKKSGKKLTPIEPLKPMQYFHILVMSVPRRRRNAKNENKINKL